jgi:hypothetical protein
MKKVNKTSKQEKKKYVIQIENQWIPRFPPKVLNVKIHEPQTYEIYTQFYVIGDVTNTNSWIGSIAWLCNSE